MRDINVDVYIGMNHMFIPKSGSKNVFHTKFLAQIKKLDLALTHGFMNKFRRNLMIQTEYLAQT